MTTSARSPESATGPADGIPMAGTPLSEATDGHVLHTMADLALATVEVMASAGSGEQVATPGNSVVTAYQQNVEAAQPQRAGRSTTELERADLGIEAQIVRLRATAALDGAADPSAAAQLGVRSQRLAELDWLRQQFEVDALLVGSGVEFVGEASARAVERCADAPPSDGSWGEGAREPHD